MTWSWGKLHQGLQNSSWIIYRYMVWRNECVWYIIFLLDDFMCNFQSRKYMKCIFYLKFLGVMWRTVLWPHEFKVALAHFSIVTFVTDFNITEGFFWGAIVVLSSGSDRRAELPLQRSFSVSTIVFFNRKKPVRLIHPWGDKSQAFVSTVCFPWAMSSLSHSEVNNLPLIPLLFQSVPSSLKTH